MHNVTPHKLEVGERLQLVIQSTGLTNAAWGRLYGRNKANVTAWVKGRSYPDIEVMVAMLANHRGLTLDWLYAGRWDTLTVSMAASLRQPMGELLLGAAA